jgi:lysyl-tRNA synthetase class 2
MDLQKIQARSHIIRLIRSWFDDHGFLEMHTPRLIGLPGQEPYLEPFWTDVVVGAHGHAPIIKHPAALITSPEYMMKRLLAEGFDKIYDLGPCFRNNEPWDGTHDPEFLLIEWYRRDAGITDLMRDTEEMVKWVSKAFGKSIEQSFRRLTVVDAWKEYADIDLIPLLENREALATVCRERHQTVSENDSWDDLYFKMFLTEIEPKIGKDQPTFLYRYPASMAALARHSEDDARFSDRVELYVGSLELANGFAELSDATEQRARFIAEQKQRSDLGKPIWAIDERFLEALPKMGNSAGIAFGIDRFVMLLTDSKSISEILPSSAQERFINP